MPGGAGHPIPEPGLAENRAAGEGLGRAEEVPTRCGPSGVCFLRLGPSLSPSSVVPQARRALCAD